MEQTIASMRADTETLQTEVSRLKKELEDLKGLLPQPQAPAAWTGYYEMNGKQNDMSLSFALNDDGSIVGGGTDNVGDFSIQGVMEASGSVRFDKVYIGKHTVKYTGELREVDTGMVINGVWALENNPAITGSFELKTGAVSAAAEASLPSEPQAPAAWTGYYEMDGTDSAQLNDPRIPEGRT